ncbi:hypothetical protein BJY21_001808 [Kineosphaera limosa]|nr:hypothetical protein [Kineosphaera limosa]
MLATLEQGRLEADLDSRSAEEIRGYDERGLPT